MADSFILFCLKQKKFLLSQFSRFRVPNQAVDSAIGPSNP